MSIGIPQNKIAAFWSWFSNRECDQEPNNALDELTAAIRRIHANLSVEISWDSPKRELLVTANGKAELFPLADAIVAAAPRLSDWKIDSLKPPMGFDFITTYEGLDFDPKELWFMPLETSSDPYALGIEVGIANLEMMQRRQVEGAVDVILLTGLGERSFASDLQHVRIGPLPQHPESEGYIELVELPAYIKWWKSRTQD